MATTYTPIATTTLGSAQSSVTFSSISGSYTDLIIACSIKLVTADYPMVRINGDSGTNYSDTSLFGNGTSVLSEIASNVNRWLLSLSGGNTQYPTASNTYNSTILHFMNYSNSTTYKTMLARSDNASRGTVAQVNLWRNTNAITSLVFSNLSGGNFDTGSTFTLYGIKAA